MRNILFIYIAHYRVISHKSIMKRGRRLP